jgi:hypothetical protein
MYYLVTAQPADVVDRKAKPQVPIIIRLPDGGIDYYKGQPPVVDRNKRAVREGQREYPYGGCYVNALVSFWAQRLSAGYGPRINCNLLAVQFSRDGETFSGRAEIDTDDAFEAIGDVAGADAAAAGGFLD